MIINVLLLIVAYLLGSIPSGLWIGKIFFHKNLHDFGSGNTGTTNTFRILGTKAGVIVFILDLLKGLIAVLLPTIFAVHSIPALVFGLVAVLGHTISIFDGFKGGKAVATSAGVIVGYNTPFLIYLLIVFIIVLFLFSMISLSSVTAAVAALIGIIFFPHFGFLIPRHDFLFEIIILALALIIIIRHRSNIKRIKQREESTVPFGLNLSKQKSK